jgi:nitrite reductase/ring-hydroxylating ferredoxin subunit
LKQHLESAGVRFLCRHADVTEGESRGFDPLDEGRDTIFAVRKSGRLYAYRDACPHYGDTPMAWMKDRYVNADCTRIVCFAHGAEFDVTTGECQVGPCLGQRLEAVEITVTDEGNVFLSLCSDACVPNAKTIK